MTVVDKKNSKLVKKGCLKKVFFKGITIVVVILSNDNHIGSKAMSEELNVKKLLSDCHDLLWEMARFCCATEGFLFRF